MVVEVVERSGIKLFIEPTDSGGTCVPFVAIDNSSRYAWSAAG